MIGLHSSQQISYQSKEGYDENCKNCIFAYKKMIYWYYFFAEIICILMRSLLPIPNYTLSTHNFLVVLICSITIMTAIYLTYQI